MRSERRLLLALGLAIALIAPARAVDALKTRILPGSDFASAHEVLIESIEAEGLVVGEVIPYNRMLERTAPAFGRPGSPFAAAEVVQFCSSAIAWQLLDEQPAQIGLCPLSFALYERDGRLSLVFRSPGRSTAGRRAADALLHRLAAGVVATLQRRAGR